MAQSFDEILDSREALFVDDDFTLLPDPEPRPVWCPVISVDDHVFESATTFTRVPEKFRDVVPQLVEIDGRPAWRIGDRHHFFTGVDGAAGRPISEWRSTRMRLEDYRRGVWDVDARVLDMDLNGIWASLCFPSVLWGFAGTTLARIPDRDAGFAAVQSYNDWMVEEWWGAHPDRFIPCQLPYLADPELAANEIRRNAERGVLAVSFSENPAGLGFPSIHTDHWDPFFKACEECGTVVNLHLGSSGGVPKPSPDSPDPVSLALFPINGIESVVEWIYSRIPLRFPTIKIVLSEAGVSWVPMVIERLRRAYRQREAAPSAWLATDPDPVTVLRRNFWFTSIEDPSAFHNLEAIGEDRVMVEVDYPHTDSSWPDSQELFRSELEHLPVDTIKKICFGNAAELYKHTPPPESLLASSTLIAQRR